MPHARVDPSHAGMMCGVAEEGKHAFLHLRIDGFEVSHLSPAIFESLGVVRAGWT
jgi:hypothetical protein